jgi:polysaccharide export outer membrane protein
VAEWKWRYAVRIAAAGLAAVLLAGCATSPHELTRPERYRPDDEDRDPEAWVVVTEDGVPPESEDDGKARESVPLARTLKRGGQVSIFLRGIPSPEEVIEIIDDLGSVSLPLIGTVEIAGLTTADAEDKIARMYMDSGYYKSITVNLVAEREEYFVRGEVKTPGAYEIAGDRSLLRAITAAGGYTDYARRSRIRIMRQGQDTIVVNAGKIEQGHEPDPLIEPGDIIIVPKKFW